MRRCSCAFTLAELLSVMAVIAVLAALIYPASQRMIEGGRATACISHLSQIGVALNLYAAENGQTMPTLQSARKHLSENVPVIDNTLEKYLADRTVFACPADRRHFAELTGTSYYWNIALNGQSLANLNFLALADHSHIPILSDKEGFHPYASDKVNILYADGHATQDVKFFTTPP